MTLNNNNNKKVGGGWGGGGGGNSYIYNPTKNPLKLEEFTGVNYIKKKD